MMLLLLLLLIAPQANAAISKSDMDNVRLQVSHGWLVDAEQSLTELVNSPQGADDALAWLELAKLRASMGRIPQAKTAVATAETLAKTSDLREMCLDYRNYLESNFGLLRANAPRAATLGLLEISYMEMTSSALVLAYMNQLQKRLSLPQHMPLEVWLPVGSYTVNEEDFSITAGGLQDITLRQKSLSSSRVAFLNDVFVETGAGVGGWLGTNVILPEPSLATSIGLYTGPIVWRIGANKSGWIYQSGSGQNTRVSRTLPAASLGYALWMSAPIHAHVTFEAQKLIAPRLTDDGTVQEQAVSMGGLGLHTRASYRLGSLKVTFGIRTVLLTTLEQYELPMTNKEPMHLDAGAVLAIAK